MAIDLKPYYDAAQQAGEDVQRILGEMQTSFNDGTPEGQEKALALRPQLDAAKKKADEANALYVSVRDAASTSDNVAKNFVPVTENAQESGTGIKTMSRSAFEALDSVTRMAFVKDGGKISGDE